MINGYASGGKLFFEFWAQPKEGMALIDLVKHLYEIGNNVIFVDVERNSVLVNIHL